MSMTNSFSIVHLCIKEQHIDNVFFLQIIYQNCKFVPYETAYIALHVFPDQAA